MLLTCIFPFVAALRGAENGVTGRRPDTLVTFDQRRIECGKRYLSKRQSEQTADYTPKGFQISIHTLVMIQ